MSGEKKNIQLLVQRLDLTELRIEAIILLEIVIYLTIGNGIGLEQVLGQLGQEP
jgi:hypothetical protein